MKQPAGRPSHDRTPDFLTGLWNQAAILDFFHSEAERCMRTGSPLGVLLGDVDDLNRINESHGKVAGDLVLREVAWRLGSSVRPYDWVGRYGQSTFLVLVPGCSTPDIWRLGERLRAVVSAKPIATPSGPVVATMSWGVAAWNATRNVPMDQDALLRACAAALAESKKAGQDRVSFAAWQEFRSRKDIAGAAPQKIGEHSNAPCQRDPSESAGVS
jgi:two-component system cell cycle response regulator